MYRVGECTWRCNGGRCGCSRCSCGSCSWRSLVRWLLLLRVHIIVIIGGVVVVGGAGHHLVMLIGKGGKVVVGCCCRCCCRWHLRCLGCFRNAGKQKSFWGYRVIVGWGEWCVMCVWLKLVTSSSTGAALA